MIASAQELIVINKVKLLLYKKIHKLIKFLNPRVLILIPKIYNMIRIHKFYKKNNKNFWIK